MARHVRRPGPYGSGGEFQHRRRRRLGICGLTDLSRADDGARVSVWYQLFDLFYDALSQFRRGRRDSRFISRHSPTKNEIGSDCGEDVLDGVATDRQTREDPAIVEFGRLGEGVED